MRGRPTTRPETIARRRALRTLATTTGGLAALVAACRGDDGAPPRGAPGTPAPAGESAQAKPGGTFKHMLAAPPGSLSTVERPDPSTTRIAGLVYSGLLGFKWGQESVPIDDYGQEPDLAQAMPEQPDSLTYIFKLRPGVQFHNGRPMTAEDVQYSFDRYATLPTSARRAVWQPWFERVEAPDAHTVVVRTKFPYADAIEAMGANQDGFVLAKEFEESQEATGRMMGSGPFVWADAAPPISITFRRNPTYHAKPFPYFDEVQILATTDIERRIVDFTSRQVHMPWLVYPEERDRIKRERPDARFQENVPYPAPAIIMRTDQPPFNDKRVRQALSMAIDRKKIRDGTMKGIGEPDQMFPIAYAPLYGTRAVKDLGAAARYWEYNPAEAKRLLAAAGVDKITADMTHWDAGIVGAWLPDTAALIAAQWRELGIAELKDINLSGPQYVASVTFGQYNGMVTAISSGIPGLQRGLTLRNLFWSPPEGVRAPTLNNGYVNNPLLSQLVEKQLSQLNVEERKQTFRQIEEIFAEEQYRIVLSATSQTWFWDPSLRNIRLPREQSAIRYAMRWWFG